MSIHFDKDLKEELSHSSKEFRFEEVNIPPLKRHKFSFAVFAEFFGYCLINAILGPLSYFLFYTFMKNGSVLAHNLHVIGRKHGLRTAIVWIMKVFCYIVTFTFVPDQKAKQNSSMSQFWLLIYTDISLIVLYAGYYSSFSEEEIVQFKTEAVNLGENIFNRLIKLMKQSRSTVSNISALNAVFPGLDPSNFYFIYPESSKDEVPYGMEPKTLEEGAPELHRSGVSSGIMVSGEKFTSYLLDMTGYSSFEMKINIIKGLSRVLIFFRVILPLLNNLYQVLSRENPFDDFGRVIVYALQQIFYSVLIYRFVSVYDVIFLGLLIYIKKYNSLRHLDEAVTLKWDKKKLNQKNIKICASVPHNAQVWLTIRRIISSMNTQTFIVIDTNMSFILFYTFILVAISLFQDIKIFAVIIDPINRFLRENPSLLIIIMFTVLVVIIVIVADVILGILINNLFIDDKGKWRLQNNVTGEIQVIHEMLFDPNFHIDAIKEDIHYKKYTEMKELLGQNFEKEFYDYLRRLRSSIRLTIDGISSEESYNPHTLLGIPTSVPVVVTVSTVASGLLITVITQIISTLSGDKPK